MNIHVQTTHLKLIVEKKQQLCKKVKKPTHAWQLNKKMTNPSSCAIITFFGATNPCEKIDV
jgi:hypothetical protein